jgi:hypothetical protein
MSVGSQNPILEDARVYRADRLRMNNPKGWAHIFRTFESADRSGVYFESGCTSDEIEEARLILSRLARLDVSEVSE